MMDKIGGLYPKGIWIHVSELLPDLHVKVLAFRPTAHTHGDEEITILVRDGIKGKDLNGIEHDFERNHHVTHWMPLPEPPKF